MEPFFTFLGGYWWLIFPLMGVMGGIGSAWERGARRRHKRRLEVLHAKAELKAASAAARAPQAGAEALPAITTPRATPPTARAGGATTQGTQLERLFASHDAVTARWLDYELDVAKLIAFPAMSDGRQPLTAAFLRAKRVADGLRPASAKARLTKDQITEYRNAVADYEVAFDVAERDARRLKDSSFTDLERKRLDTAKQLLTIAIDEAATPAERQVAYRRVREELDGLISLSDEAIEVLEAKVSLELTTGSTPATPPVEEQPQARSADAEPARDRPDADRPSQAAPWPVPARSSDTAPGRVIRPKSHP
ncbi:hypothetical protein SAMN04487846_0293 [Microbacterium sp. cf046]|uniref:hypothetical protein n=1 Tax=Microbacterium sp. cf046 TaxID=1761803 RepID=UPI0008EECEE2|nr:hypothetical protein [Microbacterium sp. cf046]SFR88901.1 hypothetical protein SAMN04487846_0293 [Microbacterium sp. cf046]